MTDKKKATPKSWPRPGTMGAIIVEQVKKGKSLEQIIAMVREKYPRAKASLTPGGIGWWKQAMKAHGVKVPAPKAKVAKRARPNEAERKVA